ncbi:glycosyltransferase [Clostridium perfringens]|uniref:Glycosyltransferase n=1 Tax=Clostridium perfringens TaxID=1502 RepID=A0AAW9I648_CLOPF|nr:glycosyltransferase [Clostridium perfringens]MBI6056664.1 glycosyltransferase [Clostridium perfringens]MDK0550835.1 glycosyltransferase [Clostridium perfringens]MDU3642837.1 glycosyltransferase [Clostridium perfringens]MDZ4909721.1 glycosyltransferase [Clostridium perfringens]
MKKKVLFVLEAFDKGGIEKVTLDIVNNLDKEKYDITVKTIWFGGHCQSKVKKHIKVEPFFKKYRKGIMKLFIYLPKKLLYKLYIKDKYDIEIAAGDGIPSRIIAGSSNKNSKKVSWIHMDVLKNGSKLKELKDKNKANKFYKPFDLILCVSNDCKENFVRRFGYEEKCKVIYNPIPSQEIIDMSKEKIDIEFDHTIKNIVSVGRLVDEKGYDRLLKVHKKLICDGIKHNIYIIGDGKERDRLQKFINDNNLNDSIKLLGFKDNPYKYINKSDLLVVSSRNEAFSLVLVEAIILNIPVLSTICSGPRELLNNGEYGLLVDNSEEGLYMGLREILENDEIYNYYKEKVFERGNIFNFKESIKIFENKILE